MELVPHLFPCWCVKKKKKKKSRPFPGRQFVQETSFLTKLWLVISAISYIWQITDVADLKVLKINGGLRSYHKLADIPR